MDAQGRAVLRRKLQRAEVLAFFEKLPRCLVGIEAWYVKPCVKRGKTDAADAEAICEAVTRPTMRFVPVKAAEQQAALMLHRTRDLPVRQRTALVNALRRHMAEFGIVAPQGIARAGEPVALVTGEDEAKPPAPARRTAWARGGVGGVGRTGEGGRGGDPGLAQG